MPQVYYQSLYICMSVYCVYGEDVAFYTVLCSIIFAFLPLIDVIYLLYMLLDNESIQM